MSIKGSRESGLESPTLGDQFSMARLQDSLIAGSRAIAAVDAVLALHIEQPPEPMKPWPTCSCNWMSYPCETVKAITRALETK